MQVEILNSGSFACLCGSRDDAYISFDDGISNQVAPNVALAVRCHLLDPNGFDIE